MLKLNSIIFAGQWLWLGLPPKSLRFESSVGDLKLTEIFLSQSVVFFLYLFGFCLFACLFCQCADTTEAY